MSKKKKVTKKEADFYKFVPVSPGKDENEWYGKFVPVSPAESKRLLQRTGMTVEELRDKIFIA